jgi:hypothetical protein
MVSSTERRRMEAEDDAMREKLQSKFGAIFADKDAISVASTRARKIRMAR